MMTHQPITQIYILYFLSPDDNEAIPFYVGRTNDPTRRLNEHKRATLNKEQTLKYRWASILEENGSEWYMHVVCENAIDDEDSEYEWVLRFARHNTARGIEFDGQPLTNMKAGDVLNDLMAEPKVITREEIIAHRKKLAEAAAARKAAKAAAAEEARKHSHWFREAQLECWAGSHIRMNATELTEALTTFKRIFGKKAHEKWLQEHRLLYVSDRLKVKSFANKDASHIGEWDVPRLEALLARMLEDGMAADGCTLQTTLPKLNVKT